MSKKIAVTTLITFIVIMVIAKICHFSPVEVAFSYIIISLEGLIKMCPAGECIESVLKIASDIK